ncbi:MAG: TlpA family protein disulfide reductase [Chloroflexi bacterium]|nr:TlpA family protein disulfide reductase [Chloroflexota bacterium]
MKMMLNVSTRAIGFVMVVGLVAGCGGATTPTAAPTAMMEKEAPTVEAMPAKSTEDAMMANETPTADAMMAKETPTGDAMMHDETPMADSTMAKETPAGDAMMMPGWLSAELVDARSGETFKIADFKGKVVLVEAMAVWCHNCLNQQQEVKRLHENLGQREDFVSVGLGIDSNESADLLKSFVDKNGFDWMYAISPVEVARELGQLYGAQFLNPPSTPMLIVDRAGEVHPLPFGVKSAQALEDALQPYLQ